MVEAITPQPSPPRPEQLIIVSGLSGSGKSVALRTLEDLGFYCVDNLPAALMPAFVEALPRSGSGIGHRLAVGLDVRNPVENLDRLPHILSELGSAHVDYHLLFLDTTDEVLIKRYSETRRRHPLSGDGLALADAIARERQLLRPMLAIADQVIDTSALNVHQLRRQVISAMGLAGSVLTLLFQSFAYRRGVPADADFIFDARCLPNPHWQLALRPLSGRDTPVRQWLEAQPEVERFADAIQGFMDSWLPAFQDDGRSYVTLCIGCTGGRHRSVYLVERLAAHFRSHYAQVLTHHRELEG